MKNLLYSVSLTSEQRRLINRSLFSLFDEEFQSSSTSRLARLIYELNCFAKPCERVFLSTGSWLLVLRALRFIFLRNNKDNYYNLLNLKIIVLGRSICEAIEKHEGDIARNYKQFRFFVVQNENILSYI